MLNSSVWVIWLSDKREALSTGVHIGITGVFVILLGEV